MLNRKLLEVIKRFAPAERLRLRQYIGSPYFNEGRHAETLVELYDFIVQFDADENNPNLDKELVFKRFFPDQEFKSKEKSPLDSLTSALFQLVRNFLSQQSFEAERTTASDMLPLLRFYRKNGLEERFWQSTQAVRKAQDAEPVRGAQYFYDQFRIEEEISNFQGVFNTYEDDANLNAANDYLDTFFSIVKLEHACALNHWHQFSQINIDRSRLLTQAVLEYLAQEDTAPVPIAELYKTVLALIQNPADPVLLQTLEDLLQKYNTAIPKDKYRDLQTYYRGFWARQYMQSGSSFNREKLFDILVEHLSEGYFYIDDKLTPNAMRLLLNFGLKLGKFDWVERLLQDHPPERICGTRFPAEVHNLHEAEWLFYKKDYEQATDKLIYRPFENPNISIQAELMLIKIYYETQDDLLDSRIKALDQKIRRTKLSKETKAGYYNFLKKLDKIIKYGWQKDNPKRPKLMEEIKSQPNVFSREWLLDQMGPET